MNETQLCKETSETKKGLGASRPILPTLNGPPGESGGNMWAKLLRGSSMHMQEEPWCLDTLGENVHTTILMYSQMQGTGKAKEAKKTLYSTYIA